MIGMMTLIMICVLGFMFGALLVFLMMVIPLQKTNEELLEHIERCEYDCWRKVK